MAERFGNTWWGQEWLKSLSSIDYENRIPRGASYARRGMVTKLTHKGNVIEARVAGSRRTPYRELVVVQKFSDEEKARLIDKVMCRPALITQLLNRNLLPEMLEVARECGLKIFPEKWNDLKMNCDCPDWAVPCKHLAAVVYMMSREIDNNPFIVFEMHGIDLLEELEKRGVSIKSIMDEIKVPKIKNTINAISPSKATINAVDKTNDRGQGTLAADFSNLTDQTAALLSILPDNPAFFVNGNFKETYTREIQRISSSAQRLLNRRLHIEALFRPLSSVDCEKIFTVDSEPTLSVDEDLQYDFFVDGARHNIADLASALWALNPDFMPDYHPNVAALRQCLLAAAHLAAKGLVVPSIVTTSSKKNAIIWLPATHDARVAKIVDDINSMINQNVLTINRGKRSLYVESPARWIISMFLGQLIENVSHDGYDQIYMLFFKRSQFEFSEIGHKNIPGAIKSWIDYSNIADSGWVPIITVSSYGETLGIDEDELSDDEATTFFLSIAVQNRDDLSIPAIGLDAIMDDEKYVDVRYEILKNVSQLSLLIPAISHYIDTQAHAPIEYKAQELPQLILDVLPAVKLLGIKVYMPKSLRSLIKPRVSMKIDKKGGSTKTYLNIFDLFDYKWQVAMGEDVISPQEFEQMLTRSDGLIRFKKSFFYITAEELSRLRKLLKSEAQISPMQLFQTAMSETYDKSPIVLTEEARRLVEEFKSSEEIEVPHGLNATLRRYQQRGFSWLYRNMRIGFGSILADDMGLGKTLQTIALMQKLKEEEKLDDKALVIVPVGLISNWMEELKRFAPDLQATVYHGPQRKLSKKTEADIVITSYGVARSDADKLSKRSWQLVIIDEAQNIKNQNTAQTKAIIKIPGQCHIALSGTPVENRLSEFWSIMNFANKGYLGTLKEFNTDYAQPIQVDNDQQCAAKFRKITAPFMMRRMKTDKSIISDLPDKIEQDVYAALSPEQAAMYRSTLDEAMAVIEGMPTNDQQSLFKRQGIILQMILSLKQICNHPAQFLKNEDFRAELSGKAMMLLDRVQSIIESGGKVLIFTQFRQMGEILMPLIEERIGSRPMFYHGGCTLSDRKEMVDRFQKRNSDRVMILSLKAAGTGLNLTAASNVIHYDLWWNPAVEAQATDRAYRIGQNKNVMVDRFITKGTFEERINDMINSKRHLAEMSVSTGESWIGHLSNSELREIFG